MEYKEWIEDSESMVALSQVAVSVILKSALEKAIPPELFAQTETSPMTLANAVREAIIKGLKPNEKSKFKI